jgi:thioredoxin 2
MEPCQQRQSIEKERQGQCFWQKSLASPISTGKEERQMSTLRMDSRGVIQSCPACGQKNRTPFERLNEVGQCGQCKAEIRAPSSPVEVSAEADFHQLREKSALPLVVDFWASWCGPCLRVAPELEKVAAGNAGTFLVVKVNTEQLPSLSARYNVRSIPTMAVFSAGNEMTRTMGAQPASAIEAFVREAIQH